LEQFLTIGLNGITVGALYFIVASGFTLIFGLMRTVNLAHGALYLLGGYIGLEVARATGNWYFAVLGGFIGVAIVGAVIQLGLLGWMQGQDMRQALVSLGLSIIAADLMLAHWGGLSYQFRPPDLITGRTDLPILGTYSTVRLSVLVIAVALGVALWLLLNRTKLGMTIRAGIDDRQMLGALGIDVPRVFLIVFALGAGLAGLAGVIGGTTLSVTPGLDTRFLLVSLVVVIVGGMGSLGGAAIGALLIGLTEQYALFFVPTYAALITFALMVLVLALRPQGILGRPA
jgi:branched-chain amino acid transport system permease protein